MMLRWVAPSLGIDTRTQPSLATPGEASHCIVDTLEEWEGDMN